MKESQIQRAIMDYLAVASVPAWRMNTGAVSGEHNGKRRFFRFGQKGMADILAAPYVGAGERLRREYLWIEVKTEKGKQSQDQQFFQQYVEGEGMEYLLARSVDDVRQWLEMYGS